jgi:hypothetical protein
VSKDNPDWASTDVGRISTIRGDSLTVNPSSTEDFDASFTAPLLWAMIADVSSYNCTLAGNSVGILGSPSGNYLPILHFITPAATDLLYVFPIEIEWPSPISLMALLPGDTGYQLQVRTGPTTAVVAVGLTLYAGGLT